MRRCKKTHYRRKQYWFVAHWVTLLTRTCLGLFVSWKIGLLGVRVGEAAAPGPVTAAQTQSNEERHNFLVTGGGGRARLREAHSDVPTCILQHTELATREQTYCRANEVHWCHVTDGGRALKTAHSDVLFRVLLHASVDVESDDHVMGQECPSESDIEEAQPSASHTAAQTQSNEEKHNFLVTGGGGRSRLRSHNNFPLLQPDVRAAEQEQGARFLATDHHDNANDSTRQESSRSSLGWKFCTMISTGYLRARVSCLHETRLTEAGQVWE